MHAAVAGIPEPFGCRNSRRSFWPSKIAGPAQCEVVARTDTGQPRRSSRKKQSIRAPSMFECSLRRLLSLRNSILTLGTQSPCSRRQKLPEDGMARSDQLQVSGTIHHGSPRLSAVLWFAWPGTIQLAVHGGLRRIRHADQRRLRGSCRTCMKARYASDTFMPVASNFASDCEAIGRISSREIGWISGHQCRSWVGFFPALDL
jgi:hypothetical protein